MADAYDEESPLLQTFLDDFSIKLWKDCCQAAEKCCQEMTSETICKNPFFARKALKVLFYRRLEGDNYPKMSCYMGWLAMLAGRRYFGPS